MKNYRISRYDSKLYIYPKDGPFNDQTAIHIPRRNFEDSFGIENIKNLNEQNTEHHSAIAHLNKCLQEGKYIDTRSKK